MSYGIVYALTSPSGKHYIGQTVQTLDARWASHVCRSRSDRSYLYNAMRKHSPELWKREVVAECATKEDLDAMEIMFIAAFGDYNLSAGGASGGGWKHTDEAKAKMSSLKKGKKLSAEHRANMSSAHTGRVSTMKGKKMSEETVAKMSAAKKGKPWSASRRAAEEVRNA